jgi:hypothetical protein
MTQDLQTKVAILERDVSQFAGLFERLDQTIEKLTDVSQTIKQLLAVHESRLNTQEKLSEDIIRDMNKEVDRLVEMIEDVAEKQEEQFKTITKKLSDFDKAKWIIIGIVLAISLLSKMDLHKVLAFLL